MSDITLKVSSAPITLNVTGAQGPATEGGGGANAGDETDITGLLKGNGSGLSVASAGTDYAAADHTHTLLDNSLEITGDLTIGYATISDSLLFSEHTYTLPDLAGEIALQENLGTASGLAVGLTDNSISITSIDDVATFTYGSDAKAAHRTALGLGTGDSPTFTDIGSSGPNGISASSGRLNLGSGWNYIIGNGGDNGIIRLLGVGESGFNRLQLGGTTSSFPAIKRNAATLEVKLADDSAFADLKLRNLISTGHVKLPEFTVAAATASSSASAVAGGKGATIYVTDETGGEVAAVSDGTVWRRVTDRTAIS